uniref:Uncharacterized protein n=1 Tax=Cucumis melo TaxID=3656 RepID=A0A9I9E8C4_CUCME
MAMFLVRLKDFDPLFDATSRLAQIAREADIKFTPLFFSIIASNRSPRFVAYLQMTHHCFINYKVDNDHTSRISLESFHDALLDGGASPSMTIHLLANIKQLILRFESSSHAPKVHHELSLTPSQEEDLGEVDYAKFFSIDSKDLRRVIRNLPIFHGDSICVTATGSQVKFSIASKEIVLTKEGLSNASYFIFILLFIYLFKLLHEMYNGLLDINPSLLSSLYI